MKRLGLLVLVGCLLGITSEVIAEPHVTQWGYNYYVTSLRVGSAMKDSTKTDGWAYIDSLETGYTTMTELIIDSPFVILDGFGSGDHDIAIQAKEDNGSGDIHSLWFDDGNDQWETDEDFYSSSSIGSPEVDADSVDADTFALHSKVSASTESASTSGLPTLETA